MFAAVHGHVQVVHLLVEAGADQDLANHDGQTALMLAEQYGRVEVARLLTELSENRVPRKSE